MVYSVWVGDGEVNSDYINELAEARDIADCWRQKGYDDVGVEEIELDPVTGDYVDSCWVE